MTRSTPTTSRSAPTPRTIYIAATNAQVVSRYDISKGVANAVPLSPFGFRCPVKPVQCPDPPLPGSAGAFNDLRRVAVASDGLVYVADEWGNGIEVFHPDGSHARSIEGVTAPPPGVARPTGVDVGPNGDAYVIDRVTHRLERFSPTGTLLASTGNRGAQAGFFLWPMAVTVAPDGGVWVIDSRNLRIQRFTANLTGPVVYSPTGSSIGPLKDPKGADVDPSGRIWIADSENNRIVVFDPTTGAWSAFGGPGTALGRFRVPEGIAVGTDGVDVADTGNNRVEKVSFSGNPITALPTRITAPTGVDVAPDGTLWVTDTGQGQLVHTDAALTRVLGTVGVPGGMDHPHDVAVAGQTLYATDTYGSRVQVFTPAATAPEPDSTITTPTNGSIVHAPLALAGTATSPVGVTRVRYAIRDRSTLAWLTPSGTFGAFTMFDASLTQGAPGEVLWSANVTLPPGRYGLDVRAVDARGVVESTHAYASFTVR